MTIRPEVSASWFEERQEAFTDSLGNAIAGQTFSQGELRFGPEFSYAIDKEDGVVIRPHIGINGVWNFAVDNGATSQGAVLGTGDVRARVDAGFATSTADGMTLDISGFYDGIGIDNYEAFGGKARLSIPLN